jgi:hypothetical protein
MRSLRARLLSLGAAAAVLGPCAGVASAVPNPGANLPIGPLPSLCGRAPTSAVCQNDVIHYLDAARATLGLDRYALPADFTRLAPDRQLLVLADLDRVAYGLPPVAGLITALDDDAMQGVIADADPQPSDAAWGSAWSANWAGSFPNALVAYYEWMYDDGPGSGNLDCAAPGDEGCWGHRQDVFLTIEGDPAAGGADVQSALGAAAGADAHGEQGYAMLLAERLVDPTGPPAIDYAYTWAEATADGAGTNAYDAPLWLNPDTRIVRVALAHRTARVSIRISSATGVQCALTPRGRRRARWRPCSTHPAFRRLRRGRYLLVVRAVGPAGVDPTPARLLFFVR